MPLSSIIYIAFALSLDAMAVSAAIGAGNHRMSHQKALQIALFFGFFQFFMPLVGWTIGIGLEKIISQFGHWIAFAVLAILGAKMIVEALKTTDEKKCIIHTTKTLFLLSVATSIDALVVGVTFALLPVDIWLAVIIIGIITFFLSLFSIYIGKKSGEQWGKKAEIIGGLILIGIGIKIVLTHVLF